MLVTQRHADEASYIVCIQNLPIYCSRNDVVNLLSSMFSYSCFTYDLVCVLVFCFILVKNSFNACYVSCH